MVLPFLGFPVNVRKILFVLSGACVAVLAYLFYVERKSRNRKANPKTTDDVEMIDNNYFDAKPKMIRFPRRKTTDGIKMTKEKNVVNDMNTNNLAEKPPEDTSSYAGN